MAEACSWEKGRGRAFSESEVECAEAEIEVSERGVLYLNRGRRNVEKLAVAAHSLRKYWAGAICVVNEGTEFVELRKLCRRLDIQYRAISETGLPPYVAKVNSLRYTPFDETVFLDSDTLVVTEIDEYFDFLDGVDFVFTKFANWESILDRKWEPVSVWKDGRLTAKEIVDAAIASAPGINTGSFAFRKGHPFLQEWLRIALASRELQMPVGDEIVANIHLPVLEHTIAPPEWGVSATLDPHRSDAKIIHYHSESYKQEGNLLAPLWHSELEELFTQFRDLFEANAYTAPVGLVEHSPEGGEERGAAPTRDLIYTVAFDSPGGRVHRSMAKMLVASLLRTRTEAEVLVFRNSEDPIFQEPREGVQECFIDTAEIAGAEERMLYSQRFKFWAANFIDGMNYRKILFLDCDTMAQSDPDILFEGAGDLGFVTEPLPLADERFSMALNELDIAKHKERYGVNSGVWWVRGDRYHAISREMDKSFGVAGDAQKQFFFEQSTWNGVVLRNLQQAVEISNLKVMYPLYHNPNPSDYGQANLLHFCGANAQTKVQAMLGLFMSTFYGDASPILIDLLEP